MDEWETFLNGNTVSLIRRDYLKFNYTSINHTPNEKYLGQSIPQEKKMRQLKKL